MKILIPIACLLLAGCAHSPSQIVFASKSALTAAELAAADCINAKVAYCVDHKRTLAIAGNTGHLAVNSAEGIVRDPTSPKNAQMKAAQAAAAAAAALNNLVPKGH
jgi:hypothetical protein